MHLLQHPLRAELTGLEREAPPSTKAEGDAGDPSRPGSLVMLSVGDPTAWLPAIARSGETRHREHRHPDATAPPPAR